MIELLEDCSLDLCQALAVTALMCPDGLTEQTEHIDSGFAILEVAINNAKEKVDRAVRMAFKLPEQEGDLIASEQLNQVKSVLQALKGHFVGVDTDASLSRADVAGTLEAALGLVEGAQCHLVK
jgi:hypothetical protein